ncbi:YcxB family protein [Flavobacterium sp. DG1-102-2]|uniref:YcxB family protein n=1 Tax=Flavobacterium sp. DG1-102-2 TaxID=3081663 RepID=UPI00294A9270|nr:YcxB family protein [Flavobacterium sp. DG1-102-2]MDV6168831.1 YcxB family protein [Flavobacterium sp. DG1-102-2]
MTKEVIIKQSLTEKTLTKVSMYILYSGRTKYYLLLVLFIFTFNATSAYWTGIEPAENELGFIPLITMIIVVVSLFFNLANRSKKSFKKNPRYYTNLVFTINETEFKTEGENFLNACKWEDLVKIKSTKKWHLIYFNKMQASIIDRSQLDTLQEGELKEIFNSIKSKIKVVN